MQDSVSATSLPSVKGLASLFEKGASFRNK